MKQKLGLACALVRPPPLLLLDEPTVGVDPVSRRELWQIIDRFVAEEGTTVVMSTAYLDEAERCREILVLHEGELLGQGAPGDFSAPLAGRTYALRCGGRNLREVQASLAGAPGVADAVIQGDAVRLVLEEGAAPDPRRLAPGLGEVRLQPVAPRFEDGFVVMLGARLKKDPGPAAANPQGAFGLKGRQDSGGPVVAVDGVQRRFGAFVAVRGVTFEVRRGEVFGLLGANGAGKTTTFRMLCGLLPASAGSLRVAGVDVRRTAAAARARIGYMSQKFSLYGNLSVAQNLHFFSSAYGLAGRRRRERIRWALEHFDIVNGVDANTARIVSGYAEGVFANWLADEALEAGRAAGGPARVEPRIWFNANLRSRNFLVPGLIAVIMTLIGALLTALLMAREWERGTMEALMVTPVAMREIIAGKIVPYFILGMGGMAVSVVMAVWQFGVPLRGSPWVLLMGTSLFLLTALGMGLLISTAARVQFVDGQIAIVTTFLPAFILSGFIFDIDSMPQAVQALTYLIPARYFVSILQTVFLAGDVWAVILPNALALAFMAALFLGLTRRKARKRLE